MKHPVEKSRWLQSWCAEQVKVWCGGVGWCGVVVWRCGGERSGSNGRRVKRSGGARFVEEGRMRGHGRLTTHNESIHYQDLPPYPPPLPLPPTFRLASTTVFMIIRLVLSTSLSTVAASEQQMTAYTPRTKHSELSVPKAIERVGLRRLLVRLDPARMPVKPGKTSTNCSERR